MHARVSAVLVLLACGGAGSLALYAQGPAGAPEPVEDELAQAEAAREAEEPAGTEDEEAAEAAEDEAAAEEPARREVGARGDDALEEDDWEMPALPDELRGDDVFIPTEEVEADEEVVFPVNI